MGEKIRMVKSKHGHYVAERKGKFKMVFSRGFTKVRFKYGDPNQNSIQFSFVPKINPISASETKRGTNKHLIRFFQTLSRESGMLKNGFTWDKRVHEKNKESFVKALKNLMVIMVDVHMRVNPSLRPRGLSVVYKGIRDKWWQELRRSNHMSFIHLERTFVSTSRSEDVARRFAEQKKDLIDDEIQFDKHLCCMMRIEYYPQSCSTVNVNQIVRGLSGHSHEDEILFPPWTTFTLLEGPSYKEDIIYYRVFASNDLHDEDVKQKLKEAIVNLEEGTRLPSFS
jgi:hypothetical protein